MREFEATFLYRITTKNLNPWSQPNQTFYLIASSKKEAKASAIRTIKKGYELNKIALLGRQYGDFFHKDT